jgi:hypothetical protein
MTSLSPGRSSRVEQTGQKRREPMSLADEAVDMRSGR